MSRDALSRLVGVFGEDNLVERLGLGLDSGDDLGMAVAVRNHPPRRDCIEDPLPVLQDQVRAVGMHDLW
jgi:hypothetical protein